MTLPAAPLQIVLVAGGTGGHVFPALSVAQLLKEHGHRVFFMGTAHRFEAKRVPQYGFSLDTITIESPRGKSFFQWLLFPFQLWRAIFQARKILKIRQPNLVITFGGFVTGPAGIAARSLSIPLIIHEQNSIAGFSNRWLSKIATGVYSTFDHAFPASLRAKTIGSFLRKEILDAAKLTEPYCPHQPLRILILGGSQGARTLNQIIPQGLALLPKGSIEIQHQCGERWVAETESLYNTCALQAQVTAFIDTITQAYQWADLVISRAGALSISEILALGKPSILIPLPTAADDHQHHNALRLSASGAALLIPQAALTPTYLALSLQPFINHPATLCDMARHAKKLACLDGTEKFVQLLETGTDGSASKDL